MKLQQIAAVFAAVALVSCTKPSPGASSGSDLERRLQAIESQLSRIESAIQSNRSGASVEGQIKIYVSGEVKNPGQYMVDKEITLLAVLAVAGGSTDQGNPKKVAIQKREQNKHFIASAIDPQEILLSEGDVVTVLKRMF